MSASDKYEKIRIGYPVPILQWGSFVVGALYVNGFYINSLFIANYGIFRTELLRLDYIKVGFVFSLITLGIVLIPFGIVYLTWIVRRASKLPNFYVGLVGNSSNTILFFSLPLFFSCFATSYEWSLPLTNPIWLISTVEHAVISVLTLTAFGMIIVPAIERVFVRFCGPQIPTIRFSIAIEPLRYLPILLALFLLERIVSSIDWLLLFLRGGVYYFLMAAVFVFGTMAAILWLREVRTIRGSVVLVYGLVGFGLAVLYYMSVTSYVFGVYKFIPKNRGGGLPVTEVFIKPNDAQFLTDRAKRSTSEYGFGPYYVIEENGEYIFFGFDEMDKWLTQFVPIYVIGKSQVENMYIRRIENGFPRRNKSSP